MEYSTKTQLDSTIIPFEIRRNIPKIYKFTNIYYYDNSFHYCGDKTIKKRKCIPHLLGEHFKIDHKIVHPMDKCLVIDTAYVFWPMSLNNIGHFMYDNLLALYKMIATEQDKLDINTDVRIFFVRRPKEKIKEQTITPKEIEIFKVFSRHKVQFMKKIKQPIFIKNVIMQKTDMKTRPWKEYDSDLKNDQVNKDFFKSFIGLIKKQFNIESVKKPHRIVLLSRNGAKWRRVPNEDKLIQKLKQSNYNVESVKFENLSLKEEITLMSETKIFIAPYGAGVMASSCFLPSTSTCIIINPIGFAFKHDFPTMLVTFTKRLDIKILTWVNDIGKVGKNIYASRDANMKININKVLGMLKDIGK